MLDHGRGQELLVKEAQYIQMTPSEECFNRDGGLEVTGPWLLGSCRRSDSHAEMKRGVVYRLLLRLCNLLSRRVSLVGLYSAGLE